MPSLRIRASRRLSPFAAIPAITTLLGPVRPPCTVLCRTNAGLFEAAIRGRDRVHILGGLEPLARLILGGWQLYSGEPVQDVPSLARFRSWDELLEEAEEARDPELRFLVQIIVHYGRALPGLVADLRRRAAPHPAAAERVLSTAHKAKGLEWPRVRLADDFPSLEELDALDQDGLPYLTARGARSGAAPALCRRDPCPTAARAQCRESGAAVQGGLLPGRGALPERAGGLPAIDLLQS